ncbi:TonB-dependent receptor domain-containing protein [Capnocytophaga sp. ARDL2]|uniref:TonB-dependent receptor domain-containing protein n=1 Tax=Capnocytophaga sp. ARDL2 TaxID=3238809 RepID=UPI00355703F8
MNFKQSLFSVVTLLATSQSFAQTNEVKVRGTIIDANTNLPVEYATVSFFDANDPSVTYGELTDGKGTFNIPVKRGVYNIRIDFFGYTTHEIKNREISSNTDLGAIRLKVNAEELENIVINVERSPVEIYLDKKVYNVGNDLVVRGGNAGDVLDNIPSVEVDSDGNVSLRGNESVRVLIDGRPMGMAASISDALKMLSADAIDQVEVITNPSARYEAEGGSGIINIKLKKGSNTGFNGSTTLTVSDPWGYGGSANINYKGKGYNIYSNLGYRDNKSFGNSLNELEYFDNNGTTTKFVNEYGKNTNRHKGFNGNIGFDVDLTPQLNWSNNIDFRQGMGDNTRKVDYDNLYADRSLNYSNVRNSTELGDRKSFDYTTEFLYKFKQKGHELSVSANISKNDSNGDADIGTSDRNTAVIHFNDKTYSTNDEARNQIKADYVLPIGTGRFEVGYMGNFNNLKSSFNVLSLQGGVFVDRDIYKSNLEYIENIQAVYTQYGNKFGKWNYMLGLRYEDSRIDINQRATNDFNVKIYSNLFPSVFVNYELAQNETVSFNYSRRIRRPRGFFINPISSYSSSINFFKGNPNLDPAFTNAFELSYMKKWNYFTINTTAYLNYTTNAYTVVRTVDGVNEEGIPITYANPINLATEYRPGLEINVNYTPYRWWRINGNINMYLLSRRGDYTFKEESTGNLVTQNFDVDTFTMTARLNNRVTLPYGIEWQTNGSFRAGEKTAQGRTLSTFDVNLAFAKDIIKDKASLSLNVSDLFNSRKRMLETNMDLAKGYSEMQWRERTINLSFTYRFNQKKQDQRQRRRTQNPNESFSDEDMMM